MLVRMKINGKLWYDLLVGNTNKGQNGKLGRALFVENTNNGSNQW